MLIDWYTVIAQIINFLILVLLLRRFLYRPILKAMAERERKIAERLTEAEAQRLAAAAEIEAYQQKNAAFAVERENLMEEAQAEVAARRQAWLEQARTEVNVTRTRWQKAVAEEKESFLQTVRHQTERQTYQIIRRALTDLADADLEARIVQIFLARLDALPETDVQSIRDSLQTEQAILTLNSGFDIDNEQRQRLRQTIFRLFGVGQPLHMQTKPDVICGLELTAPGYKVAWSLASYLDNLEESLAEVLATMPADTAVEGQSHG